MWSVCKICRHHNKMGLGQPRRMNYLESALNETCTVPALVWLCIKVTLQGWVPSQLPQLTFSGGAQSAPKLLCNFLSVNFHVCCSCLGPVLCLMKQRKLMRYEVTLCHTANRIQCAQREVSERSGQRVKCALRAGDWGLGAGQRVEGQHTRSDSTRVGGQT